MHYMACVPVKNFKVMPINPASIEWIMGFDCHVCLYKKKITLKQAAGPIWFTFVWAFQILFLNIQDKPLIVDKSQIYAMPISSG